MLNKFLYGVVVFGILLMVSSVILGIELLLIGFIIETIGYCLIRLRKD